VIKQGHYGFLKFKKTIRSLKDMNRYPIYIISKGRWESRLTSKALDVVGIDYSIVIEPQELDQYSSVISRDKILVLPFSNLGQGSIPARNWVWEHSINKGFNRHWIIDDNIKSLWRYNNNIRLKCISPNFFDPMEDFVDRYSNVPMAGPHYYMFIIDKHKHQPFRLNTRIYSCILLSNEKKYDRFRWRGIYNEDTDLSLRFLKAGYCTIIFNTFLIEKSITMTMKGGNTDQLYKQDKEFDGRLEMAKSLQKQHPDVTKITKKWGRWQHQVDYRPFKKNKLIRRKDIEIEKGINNYGMELKVVKK